MTRAELKVVRELLSLIAECLEDVAGDDPWSIRRIAIAGTFARAAANSAGVGIDHSSLRGLPRELLQGDVDRMRARMADTVTLRLPDPAPGVSLSVTAPAEAEELAREAARANGIPL